MTNDILNENIWTFFKMFIYLLHTLKQNLYVKVKTFSRLDGLAIFKFGINSAVVV